MLIGIEEKIQKKRKDLKGGCSSKKKGSEKEEKKEKKNKSIAKCIKEEESFNRTQ